MCFISVPCGLSVQPAAQKLCLIAWANRPGSIARDSGLVTSGRRQGAKEKHKQRAVVLDNREQHKHTSPWTKIITEQWMKSKYPKPASCVFISRATPLLPPLQVLKGETAVPSLERRRDKATNTACMTYTQTNTHTGDIQPCFQHLISKAPGVVSLKKTWGWNLTLLLALCRLEQSSCHCDSHYCYVSNGGPANVSHPLGTSASPSSPLWLRSNLSVSIHPHSFAT